MKKYITCLLAALCCTLALAVPARRGFINYTQPDGTKIALQLHGDEFCHWLTDAGGQVYEQADDGFYRPADAATLQQRRAAANIRRSAANAARRRVRTKSGDPVALGQKHFLVILVQFKNETFQSSTPNQDFSDLLNLQGYSVNGGTGSARDFYYENSGGAFEPIFDVYGPVTLNYEVAHYGGNDASGSDKAPEEAVIEGCRALDAQIDFTQYDNDGDGDVDLVFMYYNGRGEADGGAKNTIWPHQWAIYDGAGQTVTLDGKRLNSYACTNEIVSHGAQAGKMCGIGTACHEFGHAMGLPDFYDTDYDDHNGEAGGLYDYSLMCGGSYNNEGRTPPYFNIEERIMLGWQDRSVIRSFPKSGTYTLPGINDNVAYMAPTDMNGEYFVYECRNETGWDAYLPEPGLIVYHVDRSSRNVSIYNYSSGRNINVTAQNLWDQWETYNCINENGSHPCFYVVPAGAQSNLNYSGDKFAFPGSAGKSSYTAKSWNGVDSDCPLTQISYADNCVSLYASVPSAELEYSVIANPGNGTYHSGDSFNLALEEAEARPVSAVLWYFDDEPVSGDAVTLTAGSHVIEAHLTLADGSTQIVTLQITVE